MLLQAVVTGLAGGVVLGLVALGFTLVAGTLRVLHLAHGDVVVAAVFTGILVVLGRTPVATALSPNHAALFALLVLAAGALLSAAVGWLAVRPHLPDRGRDADVLGWVAGLVAAGLLLREVLALLLPQEAYAVPDPLRLDSLLGSDGVLGLPFGGTLAARVPAVLLIGLLVGLLAERVLVRSRFGKALRAVADDPDAAFLCGVPSRRVVSLAFLAAGLLAGIAGLLYTGDPGRSVGVDDGVLLGLGAVAAALLGGLGSLRGALAGGLAVGVLQALAVQVRPQYGELAPLLLLVVLLAVRPAGLRRA
ncbi:MAG: branched-chain amino acid transporter permease [Frankiales bacterium]|nr:branched-chain amino acid transporter permease [Frankiales bacterium]